MGFKYTGLNFTLGDEGFPVGLTPANILQKEQTIVKTVAQAIIDMGIGWQLDSDKCSSMSDFKDLPSVDYNGEDHKTVLFLKNTSSKCKLLLGYCTGNCSKGVDLSDSFLVKTYNSSYSSQTGCVAGLVMSMIPGESSDTFGTTTSDLIPDSATRLTGTFTTSGSSSTSLITVANVDASSGQYWYGILATESVIGVLVYDIQSPSVLWPRCFCGKIISHVAHDSDSGPSAKYGSISFKVVKNSIEFEQDYPNSTSGETYYTANGSTTSPLAGSINNYNSPSFNFSNKSYYCCGGNCIRTVAGDWISNTATTGVKLRQDNYMSKSTQIHNDPASVAWSAFYIVIAANDLTTNGVIPGNGVKGILDTDLFRAGNPAFKGLYANGQFIGMHEGLILGWDPSNSAPPGA